MNILNFIKTWILPLAMIAGAVSYFIMANIPFFSAYRKEVVSMVHVVQPVLIFIMLFLAFCKVDIHDIRPCKWHFGLLAIQVASFVALACVSMWIPDEAAYRVLLEASMICLICPTAPAAAVVVKKPGGNAADVTTYTILINLATAIVVPLCVPAVHPHPGQTFGVSFLLIIGKVFPLLLAPFVCAVLVKYLFPSVHRKLCGYFNLSFYIWAIALALAISVTTRTIMHTHLPVAYQIGIAIVSLFCCLAQFYFGKRIGKRHGDAITSGQALGQKNTVFAIWMGYTFFTPITSLAGGFYSVWHNVINAYQLYRKQKED